MIKIEQIPECLPEGLIRSTTAFVKNNSWNYGWTSNKSIGFSHWNQNFGKSESENSLDITENLQGSMALIWNYLKSRYFPDTDLLRCYANGHTYGVEGYPHIDSRRSHDKTLVIYLNEDWKREWGGETLIYDQNIIVHAEIPKYNTGLVFPGNAWHVARSVSRICPILRTTLMFKFCPINVDNTRNNIQKFLQEIGAQKIQHRDGTLIGHLLRTYDILKSQNYTDTICKAGALHSIFGTNAFQHKPLELSDRSKVEKLIGTEATDLILLFHRINRPATLELALKDGIKKLLCNDNTYITVDQNQLDSLCAIESANLYDQSSIELYPNIKKYLKL